MKSIATVKKTIGEIITEQDAAIALYPKVIEVIKKFDGKQVNKRIETALREVDNDLRSVREHNSYKIEMMFNSPEQGYHRVNMCFACAYAPDGAGAVYFESGKGEVLHASNTIADLLKTMEYLVLNNNKLDTEKAALEETVREYLQIKESMKKFIDSKDYTVRGLLDLEFDSYKGRNYID